MASGQGRFVRGPRFRERLDALRDHNAALVARQAATAHIIFESDKPILSSVNAYRLPRVTLVPNYLYNAG